MRILWSMLVVLSLGLIVACSGGGAKDPAAVMDAYTQAINEQKVDEALRYVADDATYERPVGTFKGKAEVRRFIEDLVRQKAKVELVGQRQVSGERVTWKSRVTLTDPNNASAAPTVVLNDSESTVRDGKIQFHKATRAQ